MSEGVSYDENLNKWRQLLFVKHVKGCKSKLKLRYTEVMVHSFYWGWKLFLTFPKTHYQSLLRCIKYAIFLFSSYIFSAVFLYLTIFLYIEWISLNSCFVWGGEFFRLYLSHRVKLFLLLTLSYSEIRFVSLIFF